MSVRIARTTLMVRDCARARDFYRDVIGMRVYFDRLWNFTGEMFPGTKKGDQGHLVIMEAQDPEIGKIGLLQILGRPAAPAPDHEMFGVGRIVFVGDVDDVEALHARLTKAGAVISAPPHLFEVVTGRGELKRSRRIMFFDLDGNLFELSQPLETILR
jgi:catechol 2,3-dioxygenase-like lactoylglutathione lyase family enzyme